jgi:hypothetical protein
VNVAKLVFRTHANHRSRMAFASGQARHKRATDSHARRTTEYSQSTGQLRNPCAAKTHERHMTWTECVLLLAEPFVYMHCSR